MEKQRKLLLSEQYQYFVLKLHNYANNKVCTF